MKINNIILIFLLLLVAPKAYFELGLNSDSSIRLVQNHLFNELINGEKIYSVIPHGVLSFLQYPLKVGVNYFVFLAYNFILYFILLKELFKKGFIPGAIQFSLIYFLIGQRFIVFPVFLLLLSRTSVKGIYWALTLTLIQLNIRLPMALVMAAIWFIGVISVDKSLSHKIKIVGIGAFLMIGSILWYPVFFGSGVGDVFAIISNNNLLLKRTVDYTLFLPTVVVIITAIILIKRERLILNNPALKVLMVISILAAFYNISRPDYGTFYVSYNLIISALLVLGFHQEIRGLLKYFVVLIFFIGSFAVSKMIFTKGVKITKFDPKYAWETIFDFGSNELDRFSFATDDGNGITIFPWNQALAVNSQKRISPFYISYCAIDSVFDIRNWNTLGDTLLMHTANIDGSELIKNDINELYLGFANGYFISGVIREFDVLLTNKAYTIYVRKGQNEEMRSFSFCSYSASEFLKGINMEECEECDLVKLSNPEWFKKRNLSLTMKLESGLEIEKSLNTELLSKGVYLNRFLFDHNLIEGSEKIVTVRISDGY